jgi:hypothetical protein
MLGFDQVLIDSGFDPADFLNALHDEVNAQEDQTGWCEEGETKEFRNRARFLL